MSGKHSFFVAASIFLFIFSVSTASAANFTIDSVADFSDVNPGNGICADAGGNCTLRAAFQEANVLPSNDTIDFSSALITNNQTIVLLFDNILVSSNITLTWNGNPSRVLTISGNDESRIFDVTAGTFNLDNVQLRNGRTLNDANGTFFGNGGAVRLAAGTTVNITNSVIQNNSAENDGGAIYVSGATLTLTNSVVDNNDTQNNDGGGIWAAGAGTNVTINNSDITNNTAPSTVSDAGGIFIGAGSTLNMNNTNVSGNATNNTGSSFGGGMEVTGNTTVRINNSTFNNNTAEQGGGIYFNPEVGTGSLSISNSTIAFNTARVRGGGILSGSGTTTIRNCTIADNTVTGTIPDENQGGGLARPFGTVIMGNTIIANNTAVSAPDFYNNGAFNSLGGNLVRVRDGDGYVGSDLADNTNPNLGTFNFNGGRTRTYPLLANSPAINSGINAQALAADGVTALAFDQRGTGFPRIFNDAQDIVDIGAVEFGNAVPTAAFVTVGGRVTNQNGRGLALASILITDSQTGATRTVYTNFFGYYRFADVRAGSSYLFEVKHKRYQFAPQILTVNSAVNDLNFIAQ